MKFIALILPALALLAAAAPAPEEIIDDAADDIAHVFERDLSSTVALEKRGHGCNLVRGDKPSECNFYYLFLLLQHQVLVDQSIPTGDLLLRACMDQQRGYWKGDSDYVDHVEGDIQQLTITLNV
ncbi:MAG: hypothetical protein M1812_000291 [Candelaria pacifica]|nr:MAG: hypothetical protein M1812_000291 [Candelaria pacifica]